MKIILIILAIIGLLKLVSLFILCGIEIYHKIKEIDIDGVRKDSGIYKTDYFYIIPSIKAIISGEYFEISLVWLCFEYYCAYKINKDES